jgi:hypothetical protein
MIELEAVISVVSQYERFGWKLERILEKTGSGMFTSAFPGIPVFVGSQDALWFSRESGRGRAWELRRLSGSPFALVTLIGPHVTIEERDELLKAVENDMTEKTRSSSGEISSEK